MNRKEARKIAEEEIAPYREKSYSELVNLIGGDVITPPERIGADGGKYFVEIQAFWDDRKGGNVRVIACVDDGKGWFGIIAPVGTDFIKSPDNRFIGE